MTVKTKGIWNGEQRVYTVKSMIAMWTSGWIAGVGASFIVLAFILK